MKDLERSVQSEKVKSHEGVIEGDKRRDGRREIKSHEGG